MRKPILTLVRMIMLTGTSVVTLSAWAQTTAPGPYYAMPSWDQKLECAFVNACPRFIVLSNWGNAAVLDRETGLVWERSPAEINYAQTWREAHSWCMDRVVGGRAGWRLPSIQELRSLVDPTEVASSLGSNLLPPGSPFRHYPYISWSASTVAAETGQAWGMLFNSSALALDKSNNFLANAWCVRGGAGIDAQ